MIFAPRKKTILAVSKSTYRNFTIMDSGKKFVVFEGIKTHDFTSLKSATDWIDAWYAERQS